MSCKSSPLLNMRNNANHNTVESTVNAAAAAIVTAEARVQPPTLHKKRWGSCWSLHRCFGFRRNNKRIGHAILVPEPTTTSGPAPSASNQPPPPSSPASFLQSDPPSISQSPTKLVSLASLSAQAQSDGGSVSIFAIGPYAYETQLVSPPVFSTFTTEPSTAAFTPPPEPSTTAFTTTPPSPDVPFAQLLASSLERARRNGGTNPKFTLLSQGEFQPYHAAQVISPGSGASTPFRPRSDHFPTRKWGSRVGSGTFTPDGIGVRSRLGSGSLTPDGAGFRSRLGSGCLTPDGVKTPGQESVIADDAIAEVLSVFNSENGSKHGNSDTVIEHRVSFELTGEDVARCLESKSSASFREFPEDFIDERHTTGIDRNRCEFCLKESTDQKTGSEICCQKHHLVKFGSGKEFKFDSASNGDFSSKTRVGNSWSFFPLLQPEVS